MNFDGISVNHGALDTGAADLVKTASDISSRLDALEGDLKPLEGSWTGSAREAYREAQAAWDRAIAEMIGLLQQSGTNVADSNREFQAADRRGASRF